MMSGDVNLNACSELNNFNCLSDCDLISEVHCGTDARNVRDAVSVLLSRYMPLVISRAHTFSDNYSDIEDMTQEGLLALYKAIDSFRPERSSCFSAYADACVSNRIKSVAVKAAKGCNNLSISEDTEIPDSELSPEGICLEREYASDVSNRLSEVLSPLEREVFSLYLDELPYVQIAARLGISEKSVDNAVFRLRKKLKAFLDSGRFNG